MSSDEWINQIVEGTPIATLVIDTCHVVRYWNHAAAALTGVPAAAMLNTTRTWYPFYPQERPIMADLLVDGLLEEQVNTFYLGKCRPSAVLPGSWEAEDFFPDFPGGGKWLAFTAAPLRDKDGTLIGAIETLRDVTAEKQAQTAREQSERMLGEIIDGCPVPMIVIDASHTVTHWNRAAAAIFGIPGDQMVGTQNQWRAFYTHPRPIMADIIAYGGHENAISAFYAGKYTKSELIPDAWEAMDYFPNFPTGPRWLHFTASALHDGAGDLIGAVETLRDITTQKQYEKELEHQAKHDALTGLANRALLQDRLAHALQLCARDERMMAVLFIDLDNFKVVNDTLGHSFGDDLVRAIARRIEQLVRSGDTVARVGGDEFVVLLHAPESEDRIAEIMRRLLDEISQPVEVRGQSLRVGCSIGAAIYPRDGNDPAVLMRNADTAMYQAKRDGRNAFHFFNQKMHDHATERMEMERDLRLALERDEFFLYYQPQVDMSTGMVVGAEALLRWRHPRLGLLPPSRFIPLAEETGLIVPIDRWVMKHACGEADAWQCKLDIPLHLSVNLSSRQFRQDNLLNEVHALVTEFGSGGGVRLGLELTESMVMQDAKGAATIMNDLKAMGVELSMDDFGTGYSSLSYLRHFPFDILKIDQSFVFGLGKEDGAEAIVRAILALAEAFNLSVIAEGVETQAQADLLMSMGCKIAQGYLYGGLLTGPAFQSLLGKPCPKVTVL